MTITTSHPLSIPPERLRALVTDEERWRRLAEATERTRDRLHARVLWSITTNVQTGGVSELVRSHIAYARGAGIDGRWESVPGDGAFFRLTHRLHSSLHGERLGPTDFDDDDRRLYEGTLREGSRELLSRISPGDVVVLHGTAMAGLVDAVRRDGAHPVWRCHVGSDTENAEVRLAWSFLLPYVRGAEAHVFSREGFVWEGLEHDDVFVISPALDPLSPKNQEIPPANVGAILAVTGLQEDGDRGDTSFVRLDGVPGRVDRPAAMLEEAPLPRDAQVIVQVGHWAPLKDPVGVVRMFAEHVAPRSNAHLVVAGPAVDAIADEPESREVFEAAARCWRELQPETRARVHLAEIPLEDADEAAVVVNALQRRADVVLQKSRGEGFGMTALEAAWKSRPLVCTRVGGLQDQVIDGVTGYLIERDDHVAAGAAINELLGSAELRQRMGLAAHEHVREHFVLPASVEPWIHVIEHVLRNDERRSTGFR